MTSADHIDVLVRAVLDDFDSPGSELSSVLRRTLRIAHLRNDIVGVNWLELEAFGTHVGDPTNGRRTDELRLRVSPEEFRRISREDVGAYLSRHRWPKLTREGIPSAEPSDDVMPASIGEIQADLQSTQAQLDELIAEEARTRPAYWGPADDLDHRRLKRILRTRVEELTRILTRTRQAVHDYLIQTELQLQAGQTNADVFERNRRYVDSRLELIAPEVLDAFASIYQRLSDGEEEPEARSQALSSCRRVLKALADRLYPPRNEQVEGVDGELHAVTDDRVTNRLVQYVFDAERSRTSRELLARTIESFGLRIDGLTSMANKGVHADVSQTDAEQCMIQTYLLVGDLLRLEAGVSALHEPPIDDGAPGPLA